MSDIDRVFARLGGGSTASRDQRELRNIPRTGRATGSRVVEVVRMPARSAGTGAGGPRRVESSVRAATWDDGFPARSVQQPSPAPEPAVVEASEAVTHVMPMWERTEVEPVIQPAPPAEPVSTQTVQPPAERAQRQARRGSRRVADPFDPQDDGANCLRCGFMVQPARERRGLVTCAACG